MIKQIWTDADFPIMSWHDCKIYSFLFGPSDFQLSFDIDYIKEWKKDESRGIYLFNVVAATLIFKNVYDINCSLFSTDVVIQDIERTSPRSPRNAAYIENEFEYDWTINTNNGEISFISVGFAQHSKGESIFSERQSLGRVAADIETFRNEY